MKLKKQAVREGVVLNYKRFPEIPRPKYADTLRFPTDITRLTAQNVSELLGKYTELAAYTSQELSRINIEVLRLQTEISSRRNFLFHRNPSMNAQERWRRDAVLDSDFGMEKFDREISNQKMRKEYTEMFLGNFEKYITALSRELSRKTHDQIR